jgi:hypothetical protein
MSFTNSDLTTLVDFKAVCRDACGVNVDLVRFRHDGAYSAHLLAELEKSAPPHAKDAIKAARPLASGGGGAKPPPPAEKYRGSLR